MRGLCTNLVVLPVETVQLQARIDAPEKALRGATICPLQDCGTKAHSRGREALTVTGRHGKTRLKFRHAKRQTPACDHMVVVAQSAVGLGSMHFTPGCAEAITMAATALPHGKAVSLLGQLLKIDVSEHATQDLLEVRGEALAGPMRRQCNSILPMTTLDYKECADGERTDLP